MKNDRMLNPAKNRAEFYFEVLQLNAGIVSKMSIFTGLFAIPLLIAWLIKSIIKNQILMQINEASGEMLNSLILELSKLEISYILILLPVIIILFIGLSGGFCVAKRVAFRENVSFFTHFKQGIVENFKNAIISGIIFWIVIGSVYFVTLSVGVPEGLSFIVIALFVLITVFLIGVVFFVFSQSALYKNNFFSLFKNALILALNKFYLLVPIILLTALPFVIIAINSYSVVSIGVIIAMFLFVGGALMILFTVFSHYVFDICINKKFHSELVDKWREIIEE